MQSADPIHYAYSAEARESTKQRRVTVLNSDDDKIAKLPENYLANTNKEELCLEYVRNFNSRFKPLHPTLDPLFLIARNEYGVEKFVPTCLRPTLLPFKEVYDLADAAAFVANYLHYEPLENPCSPPSCLPSPSQVLEWGCGDSFDLAILLTSFLLGAGYDAFVVQGKAPRAITLRDQSALECPVLVAERAAADRKAFLSKAAEAKALAAKPTKYVMPEHPATASAFEAKHGGKSHHHAHTHSHHHVHHGAGRGAAAGAKLLDPSAWLPEDKEGGGPGGDEAKAEAKNPQGGDSEAKEGRDDAKGDGGGEFEPLAGKRLHCWVLVRGGKRGVEGGHKLVEPSTGAVYECGPGCPYERVDTMFNAQNFFVNLQPASTPVGELSFDVLDNSRWEFAFLEPSVQLATKEAAKELAAEGFAVERTPEPQTPKSPKTPSSARSPASARHKRSEPVSARGSGGAGSPRGSQGGSPRGGGGDAYVDDANEEAEEAEAEAEAAGLRHGEHGLLVHADDEDNILDLPPSWVGKLRVSRPLLSLQYPPTGSRTTIFKRCKHEVFAEALHAEGCVERLTLYRDSAQTVVTECRERFLHRADKLAARSRFPLEGKVVEAFLPGRPGSLKQLTEWAGKRREVDFYSVARQDGLARREEDMGRKVIERFDGTRPDRMEYRSVSVHLATVLAKPAYLLPSSGPGAADLVAHKMAVKYAPAPGVKASVSKRSFYLRESRIRIQHHLTPGVIAIPEVTLFKETGSGAGGGMGGGATVASSGAGSGGPLTSDDKSLSGDPVGAATALEREVLADVKRSAAEAIELLKQRRREEADVVVDEPLFSKAVKQRFLALARGEAGGGGGGRDVDGGGGGERDGEGAGPAVDYLTPFLVGGSAQPKPGKGGGASGALPREEAQKVRDACLKSLKERLLERANIIQNRLNEENAKLSKRQATFQRNAARDGDPAAEEEFERFCSDAMFTIGILEQRLVSHEESALKKYQALDERLSTDPRLAALAAV